MVNSISQKTYEKRMVHLPVVSSQHRLDADVADAVLETLAQKKVRAIEILPDQDLDKARNVIKELKHMKGKFKKIGVISGGLAAGSTAVSSVPLVETAAAPLAAGMSFASNYYGVTAGASAGRKEGVLVERRQQIIQSSRNMYKTLALRLLNRYLEGEYGDVAEAMTLRLKDNLLLKHQEVSKHNQERDVVIHIAKNILRNMEKTLTSEVVETSTHKKQTKKDLKKSAKTELETREIALTKAEIDIILEPLKNVCKAIQAGKPEELMKLGFKHEYDSKRMDHELKILEEYMHIMHVKTEKMMENKEKRIQELEAENIKLKIENKKLETDITIHETLIYSVVGRIAALEKKSGGG